MRTLRHPHSRTDCGIEHPLRDLKAVAFLFSRDVAAIHRRLVLALFSADQDFAPEQRMPGIPDLAKLSLVGLVLCGCIMENEIIRAWATS